MTPRRDSPARDRVRFAAGAAVLVAAVFVAYLPAVHGGPVWDDDYMLTGNRVMADPRGLWRLLFDRAAMPVYYPLTDATLWFEARLFGLANLTGYHVVNALLHAANAVLAWRLLRRLAVPGAFAAAAVWALHPVGVESVAWVTEHKNTLSGLFYLASLWCLLRYFGVIGRGPVEAPDVHPGLPPPRRLAWYVAALALFGLALTAKTTAVTLPAAALLVVWWKAGRVRAGDVWAVLPFLVLAAVAGGITQSVETSITGTWRPEWGLTGPQQVLVAGRALWFYAAKLAWPAGLSFAYPRWTVDPGALWQWAYPATAVAVVVGLWLARRRVGRGPLVGVLFFTGTLAPALGFFHVLYQRYSFVADHFQYLAGLGLIAGATAAVARLRLPAAVNIGVGVSVALALATVTFRSAHRFASDEAAWSAALAVDPASPNANVNLASDLVGEGHYAAAEPLLARAAASPLMADRVWANRGAIAEGRNDYRLAVACYGRAVQLEPDDRRTRFQYGTALLVAGQPPAAAEQLRAAVRIDPDWADAHDNLGVCLLRLGRPAEAVKEFRTAKRLNPSLPLVQRHLTEAAEAAGGPHR